MYNKNTEKDLVSAALTGALGAGIVTSFAVSQGQHFLLALAITALAGLAAALFHKYDLL